jgi:antitoxin VapB
MTVIRSKVFRYGNSQAIRLPAQFRLDCDEVTISRDAKGALLVQPIVRPAISRGQAILEVLNSFESDYADALADVRRRALPMHDREELVSKPRNQ